MKKRLLSLFLLLTLLLSLVGCGANPPPAADTASSVTTTTTTTVTTTVPTEQTCIAAGLYVDDGLVGMMENQAAIQEVLEHLQTEAAADFADILDVTVSFVQDVQIKEEPCAAWELLNAAEMTKRLTAQRVVNAIYTVQTGDTFAGIANKHNLTTEELKKFNPDVKNTNALEVGQELTVQPAQRLLQVKVEVATYDEGVVIPYKTKTLYRDDKEADWSQVTTEGKDGLKNVTTHVTYVDGVEIDRVEKEEIIQADITKVVEVGAMKEKPEGWVWPVPICHRVYQGYSSSHKGIAISSGPEPVLGEPAVAANGGTVIEASTGWNSGYGTLVKIQHDNGIVTVYAHLQSLSVKVGQQVTAGQEIGKVGNTGYSYGPHLYFEVIKNGVKVNPLDYVTP